MSKKTYADGCSARAVCNLPTIDQSPEWLAASAAFGEFLTGRAAGELKTIFSSNEIGSPPLIEIVFDDPDTVEIGGITLLANSGYSWQSTGNIEIFENEVDFATSYIVPVQGSGSGTENDFEITLTIKNITSVNPVRVDPPIKKMALGKLPASMNKFVEYAESWVAWLGDAGASLEDALNVLKGRVALAKSPATRTRSNIVAMDNQRRVVETLIRSLAAKQRGSRIVRRAVVLPPNRPPQPTIRGGNVVDLGKAPLRPARPTSKTWLEVEIVCGEEIISLEFTKPRFEWLPTPEQLGRKCSVQWRWAGSLAGKYWSSPWSPRVEFWT